jgi:flagellar biosynthesis protein FliP
MIITLELLVRLRHMSNHRKVEKVNYNVGIEGFLICHLNWGQKSSFLIMLNFI